MTPYIIISIACVFGIFQLFRITNTYATIITSSLILGVLIALLPSQLPTTIGFYLFVLTILASAIYVLAQKMDAITKGLMLIVILPVLVNFLFRIQHWPFLYRMSIFMIVPITAYLLLIFRKTSIKNELGFLTIIAAEAVISFSIIISYWLHLD